MSRKRRAWILSALCLFIFAFFYGIRAKRALDYESSFIDIKQQEAQMHLEALEHNLAVTDPKAEDYPYLLLEKAITQGMLHAYRQSDRKSILDLYLKREELKREQEEKSILKRTPHDRLQAETEYRIHQDLATHDIPLRLAFREDGVTSVTHFLEHGFYYLLPLLCLFMSGDLYAREKGNGSLKLMLQKRASRSSLFLGLFFESYLLSLVIFFSSLLGLYIGSSLMGGWGDFRYPVLVKDHIVPSYNFLFSGALYLLSGAFFYTSLGFFLSLFFKKSWLALPSVCVGILTILYLGMESIKRLDGGIWLYSPFGQLAPYQQITGKWVFPIFNKSINEAGQVSHVQAMDVFQEIPLVLSNLQAQLMVLGTGLVFFGLALSYLERKDLL